MFAIFIAILRLGKVCSLDYHHTAGIAGHAFLLRAGAQFDHQSDLAMAFLSAFSGYPDLGAPTNLIFVGVGLFVSGAARYFLVNGMERL